MKTPQPGEVIHGRSTTIPPTAYDNEAYRTHIEDMTQRMLAESTGLVAEDTRWSNIPASQHTDEVTGEVIDLPEMWMCTVKAVGSVDLAV